MNKKLKQILLIGLLAMVATGVVACKDKEEATSSPSYDKESESSLPSSEKEDSSSADSEEENFLPATDKLYLCYNHTTNKRTQYILTWPEVDGAAKYEISAYGQTFKTKKNSYDFTSYCSLGTSVEFSVKAMDAKGEDLNSATTIVEKIEVISSGLTYSLQEDKTYIVHVENANAIGGRLVLPDTYDGKEVTKTMKSGNFQPNGIKSVRFPKYLTEIGETTFYESSFKNIVIPEGVTTIGREAFGYVERLETVSFPASLTSIGENAFTLCAIKELFLPKNIMSLSDSSFSSCQNLEKVIFEEDSQMTELPLYVFSGCDNLSEINIPEGMKKIGTYAFDFCNFTQITLPDSLQTIEISAFSHNKNLTTIHIPKGVTDLQGGALWSQGDASFTSFTVAEDNPTYKSIDGNIYSKDGTRFVQYATAKPETEFTVPGEVTEIGDYAFASAGNLLKVTLPQGIKEIGVRAFYESSLAEINTPDGLTALKGYAFAYAKLTELILPDSVTVIEDGAIGWLHLEQFRMPKYLEVFGKQTGLNIEVLELPEGMKLQSKVLAGTSIQKLIVPETFEASEGEVFGSSIYGEIDVPDVLYKGTEAELSQLMKDGLVAEDAFVGTVKSFMDDIFGGGSGSNKKVYATIYYYSENEPPLNEDGTAYDGNYWHYAEDGVTPVIWEK